jgi:diguanylate cyclase (GGDEF)-like protein
MPTPPALSPDEPLRLRALRKLNIVDTPLEERFERITRLARRLLEVEVAAISLVEANRQWFKSAQGHHVTETSRDVSFCGHTILQDEVFVVPDARLDKRFSDNPLVTGPMQNVFYAGCPLKSEEGLSIGAMCVADSRPREFNDHDIQALRDLTALVEAELRAASSIASLVEDISVESRRALIDSLTRMWNREGILKLVHSGLEKNRSGTSGLALVMVDLDYFKQINDQHGHAAGDEVLRVCARRMLAAIRESDALGRLGGDEFLLLLSDCASEEAALKAAMRVREHLTATPVQCQTVSIPITASMGVNFITADSADSVDQILARADSALYDSKRQGRDRVSSR